MRRVPRSAHLEMSWRAHAGTFGLELTGHPWSRAALLTADAEDDARVLAAVEIARAPGRAARRLFGRVRLLQSEGSALFTVPPRAPRKEWLPKAS